MNKERMIFDCNTSRCVGCFACVVACNDQKYDMDEPGPSLLRVVRHEDLDTGNTTFTSLGCMHCPDAPCAAACPTGAVYRDMVLGLTAVDQDKCVGCRSCLTVCPIGAPQFTADNKMSKCDGCLHRQRAGLVPVCVKTCPSGALTLRRVPHPTAERT